MPSLVRTDQLLLIVTLYIDLKLHIVWLDAQVPIYAVSAFAD